MLTYIITRFSILDKSNKKFKSSNIELFNKKRLDYKFECFEKMTLPNIINQTNQNYIWYIYSSEYLPDEYKKRLLNLTNKYNKIKCLFIKSFNEFNKINIQQNIDYCTIRIDDDDSLCLNFIEKLQIYKENKNKIINFPIGITYTIENNEIIYGKIFNQKNIAVGLCAINMNIYDCGNHMKVHTKYAVIYDETPDMYYINCGEFCNSGRKFKKC